MYLAGGTIEVEGSSGNGTGPCFTVPVVGGAGRYAGRDTITVTHSGEAGTDTISLLPP